ncbi:MAG: hypothetical protein IPM84_11205 [Anaerolineae bacterium]|nr:hypothetical protein [Anaerolineae bacterium]
MRRRWTNWPQPRAQPVGASLHDTLSHTLSSLAVQLEAVDSVWTEAPDQAHSLLIKSIANTRGGLAESRRALHALRASPLEDLGLGLALRNLAESAAKRAGLALTADLPKQIEGLARSGAVHLPGCPGSARKRSEARACPGDPGSVVPADCWPMAVGG